MLFMCSTKFMSSPADSLWQAVSSHYGDVFEIWIIFKIIYLFIWEILLLVSIFNLIIINNPV